ncbi:MAG TPA: right-handed parallel beta-helix repeat-containing protein [Bryobacteraceae bacterium]|nr:right-handed parallel beta-helix repeat-containing protein [Bryobacteraceae bacterium]
MRGNGKQVSGAVLVLALCGAWVQTSAAAKKPAATSADRGEGPQVTLKPGDDVQRAVDRHPMGTTFVFESGLYRLQTIRPKDADTFIGIRGAILSGARALTNFTREGRAWVASNQNQQGQLNGYCDPGHPRCMHAEDLFIDDKPLRHVSDREAVGPGTWFFDYAQHKIYMGDDPAGHKVETSVARSAFGGMAAGVTIRGLTIEKYAVPAQFGAIGDQYPGPGWVVAENEVRWNHGNGINLKDGGQAVKNFVHHNGQKGIGGGGAELLIQGNEISFNNWAGFDLAWEAGGAKFAQTRGLIVRDNSIHDNTGEGLWCDVDCIDSVYEGNTVFNNSAGGMAYEISYGAVIRNNIVRDNGARDASWLWGAQIVVQNSRGVEIYGNTVEVAPDRGNGIGIIQQNRGSGVQGPHISANNYVHHNTIIHRRSPQGVNGAVADYDEKGLFSQNNRFDYNTYHVTDPNAAHWRWGSYQNWEGMHRLGQELHGTVDTKLPPVK